MSGTDVWFGDLQFLGQPGRIAVGVIEGRGGVALVDPGPATTRPALVASLEAHGRSLADIRAVLVTHIHLDHSGGVGDLVALSPDVQVFVHQRGAKHMIDPSRLVDSARRIYGDKMGLLWGDVVPVPPGQVVAIEGGEVLDLLGRRIRVAYTPGHAVHHVSYFEEASGIAFTGDVGGMTLAGAPSAIPPTPPPDIDLELWLESLRTLDGWKPRALMLAHFGRVDRVATHLGDLESRLRLYAELVRETLDGDGPDANRIARFRDGVRADLRRALPPDQAEAVERAFPVDDSWYGLARYWNKRADRAGDGRA